MNLATLALLATLAGDFRAAEADRAAMLQAGEITTAELGSLYYTTTAAVDPLFGDQEDAGKAFQFVVASLSPQQVAERATPRQISPTLFRCDLRELQIRPADWQLLAARDPYARGEPNPLVSRADWMLLQLADATENPEAYYRIAFAGQRPTTRDEALRLLGADLRPEYHFGLVEDQSGVALQGTRWIEYYPLSLGHVWGTRDTRKLTADRDPAEQPEGDAVHDAEEYLVYRRKFSAATGQQGVLLFALLADGLGNLVERAPVDIVEDHTRFRGLAEIRLIGSCLQCHDSGPNGPKVNALRRQIEAGVDRFAQIKDQQAIEAFHFQDLGTTVNRNRDDYAAGVRAAVGVSPQEATALFRRAVLRYDRDVDLETAAFEFGLEPDEFRQRLALASNSGGLPARVAGLAHGLTMPRAAFEEAATALWLNLKRFEGNDGSPQE